MLTSPAIITLRMRIVVSFVQEVQRMEKTECMQIDNSKIRLHSIWSVMCTREVSTDKFPNQTLKTPETSRVVSCYTLT